MDKRLLLIILILILIPSVNAEYWDSGETLYGNHTYDWCLINGTLNVADYNGTAGTGELNLTCTDWINVTGTIAGAGDGWRGGAGGTSAGTAPSGEGTGGGSGGQSGGSEGGSQGGDGGAGAGYGNVGGTKGSGGAGGIMYGTLGNQTIEKGSGGGGGGKDTDTGNNGGAGGDGGARLLLYSSGPVKVSGTITMDGADGSKGVGSYGAGGGGGGSGGGVMLDGRDVNIDSGTMTVTGGDGGDSSSGGEGRGGGGGAGGRVKVFYQASLSNTSTTITRTGGSGGSGGYGNGGAGGTGTLYYLQTNDPPTTPTVVTQLNTSNLSQNYALLNVTSTDANGDSITYYFYGDTTDASTFLSSNSSGTVYNWTGLSETTYYWKVLAGDGIANSSFTGIYEFTLDTTSPYQIDLNSPVNNYNSSSTTITFNWTCSDGLTNLVANLTVDDVVKASDISTNNGTSTTQEVTGLLEDAHNWYVACIDVLVNYNISETYNFTVDLSPPDSFSNAVATPNAINERQTTIITVTVTDVLLDVDTTIMEVTNPLSSKTNFTMTKSGSVFTSSISGTNTDVVGTYYVDFYANDTVGNMNYSNYNLIFQVSQATTSGGGGGGGSPTVSAFTKRLNVITSEAMEDVIKELKLGAKRFCRVDRHIAAVFAVTGWKTGDYPATETDISGALTNPVVDVDGDIYETSASEVLKAWNSADTVVMVRGDLEVDSIAAIAYAKVSNVPILLTKPGELPSVTLDAVKKLNAKSFVIIGGEGAVSGEVADELHKLGSVARIAGDSRHETAAEVAKALEKLKDIDTIVIADGEKPGMDTAIIASGYDAPVLYVSGDIVPQGTKDFAKAHRLTKRGKEVRLVFVDVSGYIINYRLDKDF